jgi:hypothetical protein
MSGEAFLAVIEHPFHSRNFRKGAVCERRKKVKILANSGAAFPARNNEKGPLSRAF